MTRYLVTGAAGNLARLLVERLQASGKEVTGIDREPSVVPGVRFEQADITDSARMAKLVDEVRPECILHMASLLTLSSEADPATAWRVNATASIELLRTAAERGVSRFFFPSTLATYAGELPDPLPEDHPQWPVTIYGVTKVAVERMGVYLWRTAGPRLPCRAAAGGRIAVRAAECGERLPLACPRRPPAAGSRSCTPLPRTCASRPPTCAT